MDIVKLLVPIARRACQLEDMDPQSKGEFLRTLCICSDLDEDKSQLLFEHILDELAEFDLLESCEFHEGLDEFLDASRMIEIVVGTYARVSNEELSRVISVLCSSNMLKMDANCWKFVRSNLTPAEFRVLLLRVIETTCDRVDQISELVGSVFKKEEEFEIADTIRLVLESHWILDIIPQKRRKARRAIEEFFLDAFPFAKQYIDIFIVETLRFEDVSVEKVKPLDESSSSDSDVESRGSLDDFVVDDSEDSYVSSDPSEACLTRKKYRK